MANKKLNAFYTDQYHLLVEAVDRLQKENRLLLEQNEEVKQLLATKLRDAEKMTIKGSIALLIVKLGLLEAELYPNAFKNKG